MTAKAQSAMEYLMTYGWAILVIAVILAILFQIGVFSGAPLVGTSCLANTGYLCKAPTLYTNGSLSVTFGQSTGQTVTLTGISCTTTANAPSSMQSISQSLAPGATTSLSFSCPLSSNTLNTKFSGYLWAQYNTATQTGATSKIGSVTAIASALGTAPAAVVQVATGLTATNTVSCTFGSNVQAGDVLVAMYNEYGTNTGTVAPGASDTLSLPWSRPLANSYISGIFRNTIFYATATSSGSETITASSSSTIYQSMLVCYELSGVTTNGAIASGGSGNGGAPANSVVSTITPAPRSIVIGSVSWNNANPVVVPDTGYTLYPSTEQSSYGSVTEYYTGWGGGSANVGFNFDSLNTFWYEAAIALQHS